MKIDKLDHLVLTVKELAARAGMTGFEPEWFYQEALSDERGCDRDE